MPARAPSESVLLLPSACCGGFPGGGGGGEMAASGGGGSYLSSLFTDPMLKAGAKSGDGLITINLLPSAVPEPSPWAMTLAGFAGLGWLAGEGARPRRPSARGRGTHQ
jgi:hypothetical protein